VLVGDQSQAGRAAPPPGGDEVGDHRQAGVAEHGQLLWVETAEDWGEPARDHYRFAAPVGGIGWGAYQPVQRVGGGREGHDRLEAGDELRGYEELGQLPGGGRA